MKNKYEFLDINGLYYLGKKKTDWRGLGVCGGILIMWIFFLLSI